MQQTYILIADDDADDRAFVRQAVERNLKSACICEARSGEEALRCLAERADQSGIDLLLLDVNMPGLNGFEVLAKVRATPTLRHTPIAIMSTSNHPDQIRHAYREGVNCYIQKPITTRDYDQIIQSLKVCFLDSTL